LNFAMPIPQLLVSVRNLTEARAALAGGCDVLDVKEPSRGALGMADLATVVEIATLMLREEGPSQCVPCSIACGELDDWRTSDRVWQIPAGVRYAKFGPARLDTSRDWRKAWRHSRRLLDVDRDEATRAIAVAYADCRSAKALPPASILENAAEVGCSGFLVDTFRKNGCDVFQFLTVDELCRLSVQAREFGMNFALAGSLGLQTLPKTVDVMPDVIGVRSAACRGGSRCAAVSSTAVRGLKAAIAEAFSAVV